MITNPFRTCSWTRDQIENVSKGWWVMLVIGVGSVVAGGIVILADWTLDDLAVFIGALLVYWGVLTLFSVPIDGSLRSWSIAHGVVELGLGVAVWVWPEPTLLVIASLMGWLLLFRGVMAITGSISGRRFIPLWGLILAVGILEVAVSFYLLSRPGLTLVAAVLAVGMVSLVYGVVQIILALELKGLPERLDELARRFDDVGRSGAG